jgi:hypothetical protein
MPLQQPNHGCADGAQSRNAEPQRFVHELIPFGENPFSERR